MLYHASYGALTQLWAGTSPEGLEFNGKVCLRLRNGTPVTSAHPLMCLLSQYLIPWARVGKASAASYDPKLGEELWTWCEEQVANV